MKLYLSSYKLGDQRDRLLAMSPKRKIALIPNALDFTNVDIDKRNTSQKESLEMLQGLGFEVEVIDLRKYFGKSKELEGKLREIGAVFVRGGNVFILRQAMKLSGMDKIIMKINEENVDFLYAGYSAGCCVLSPDLDPYKIVDNSMELPYPEMNAVIWDGLGILKYLFVPHWDSDHPESEGVSETLEYCTNKMIKYKAIRDGEVIIS